MKINMTPFKRIAEDLMLEECIIKRAADSTDPGTFDTATLVYENAPEQETIYEGKCMIVPRASIPRVEPAGPIDRTELTYILRIPIDTDADIRPEDVVTVTSINDTENIHLDGAEFLVQDETLNSFSPWQQYPICRYIRVPQSP